MVLHRLAAGLRKRGIAGGTRRLGATTLLVWALTLEPGAAQNVIAYPARGQSQEQQERDRFDCYNWAVQQTGFNPQMQSGSTAPPPPVGGGALPGAARGAAVGAIGGAIGGDAGKGAAIGAGVGGTFGAMRRRQAETQQYQAQSQQAAANAQRSAGFDRAMGACLQGRGYTVN